MTDQLPLSPELAESRSRDITRRANKIGRKAARARLPIYGQPELIADDGFRSRATAGVPATRGDCPSGGFCPHVRCRFHLALADADTRAGRPGLSSVPRDERGLTIATTGHAGNSRPGTTLSPSWLTYRGLEVEREVKVYIDKDGLLWNVRKGGLEYWLDRLHLGELVLVFDDAATLLTKAKLTADGLAMDRALPDSVYGSSSALVLTRAREVASCALDEIARHGKPMTNEQVGDAIGRHRTLVAREVRKALGKAARVASGMGMTEGELLRGLRELGAGK